VTRSSRLGWLSAAVLASAVAAGCGGVSVVDAGSDQPIDRPDVGGGDPDTGGGDAAKETSVDGPRDVPGDAPTDTGGSDAPTDLGGSDVPADMVTGDAADAPVDRADAAPDLGPVKEGMGGPTECHDGLDNDGDGAVDCLDPDCGGQICRDVAGPCDIAEVCVAGACPADRFEDNTRICRVAAGLCDLDDKCTGSSAACPADAVKVANTSCRAPVSVCDIEDRCNGVAVDCPPDAVMSNLTVCRPSAGPCDVIDKCDGVHASCPADAFEPMGTVCRPASGVCDAAETCSGTAAACPGDGFLPATTTCRPAVGPCDAPDKCTGTSAACSADGFLGPSTVCRAPAGTCDAVPESCTGTGAACPADVSGCGSTQYCGGSACLDKKATGVACVSGIECTTGFCADGVCCNAACTGSCQACNRAGSVGTCSPHPTGTDPEVACGAYDCNGSGACLTSCSGGACSGDCKDSGYCGGTSCAAKKSNGASCASSCECGSGNCVDGVCCNTACTGVCVACNLPGLLGTCSNRAAGTDPENGCGGYQCDGNGACATTCSGCPATACKSTNYCAGSACVAKKTQGTGCGAGCECASGFCNDGVCCNQECSGPCRSCNAAGTCVARPAYQDPEAGCGNYQCNGTGACFTGCGAAAGPCAAECKGAAFCDSSGACVADRAGGAACNNACQCKSASCLLLCGG